MAASNHLFDALDVDGNIQPEIDANAAYCLAGKQREAEVNRALKRVALLDYNARLQEEPHQPDGRRKL